MFSTILSLIFMIILYPFHKQEAAVVDTGKMKVNVDLVSCTGTAAGVQTALCEAWPRVRREPHPHSSHPDCLGCSYEFHWWTSPLWNKPAINSVIWQLSYYTNTERKRYWDTPNILCFISIQHAQCFWFFTWLRVKDRVFLHGLTWLKRIMSFNRYRYVI